ncbi:MAG TPA: L,D-transpeptidase family protein [Mycobacteriales bacterium]|nr:L,D-transpeptidase family protein [Mycobacteriales bacterium]
MRRFGTVALLAGLATACTASGSAAPAAAPSAAPVGHHAAAPQHLLVRQLRGVGDARQVISVTARHYGRQHAVLQEFARHGRGWHRVAGPWRAWLGEGGFAPPGQKREGDGRTPSGSYHFTFFFGVAPEPRVHFPWRHAGTSDYWDDDPASPHYNEWVDTRHRSAGRSPEPLHVRPSYEDAAVIGYNRARVPGRGSAIFLHVTHHSPTAGCVALPRHRLLRLLRWLRPADHPRIIMGRLATVTR